MASAHAVHRSPAGGAGSPDPVGRALAAGRPLVCGVLDVTPDSSSDVGRCPTVAAAVEHGCTLVDDGADLIDVGGESARPGSRPLTLAEELDRVVPVVEALVRRVPVPLSVDTSRPEVMPATVLAAQRGAAVLRVHDVAATRDVLAVLAAVGTG